MCLSTNEIVTQCGENKLVRARSLSIQDCNYLPSALVKWSLYSNFQHAHDKSLVGFLIGSKYNTIYFIICLELEWWDLQPGVTAHRLIGLPCPVHRQQHRKPVLWQKYSKAPSSAFLMFTAFGYIYGMLYYDMPKRMKIGWKIDSVIKFKLSRTKKVLVVSYFLTS